MGKGATSKYADIYEIRIDGHISRRYAHIFAGLAMSQLPNGETILTFLVRDQAALHGLLASIRDMNLKLLSVTRVDTAPTDNEDVHDED